MNRIVNKFLLTGDKFMQTGDTHYIYKSDLHKSCFQHDMAYDKYKGLTKRTESDKVLREKAFKIVSNPNYIDMKED